MDLLKIVVECNAILSKSNTDLRKSTTFLSNPDTILSIDVLDTSLKVEVISTKSARKSISD